VEVEAPSALTGRRFVEFADDKTAYAGKLLAEMGAEVLLVEPPAGCAARHRNPDFFAFANTSKQSVVLDVSTPTDRATLRELVAAADALLEGGRPGQWAAVGFGWEELSAARPDFVLVSVTDFGQTGPQSGWLGADLVALARGGAAHTIGYAEDPPVIPAGSHSHVMAGTLAAAAALVALGEVSSGGRGQHVDISLEEVAASMSHIAGVGKYLDDGIVPRRAGTGLFASVPSGAYPCRDGLVYLMVNRAAHWKALAGWVAEETGQEAITSALWEGPSAVRIEDRELIDTLLGALTKKYSVEEFVREGQARHIAVAPLRSPAEVLADPLLAQRGAFVEVVDPHGGARKQPAPASRFARTPAWVRGAAPEIGSATGWRSGAPIPVRTKFSLRRDGGPLAGLRVVEFTAGMAAPWIGRALAWCGAEVIKIESAGYLDVTRQYVPPWAPHLGIQGRLSPWFTDWNAGKRFVALDLTQPEAIRLVRRLVGKADVVLENYTPGVLEKLGLGSEVLFAEKPDLVYFGTSGYGDSGPRRSWVSWGPNIEAASGLAVASGFAHRPCAMTHFAYPDSVSAFHGLFAVLAALEHRRRTGEGQRIHLAQIEAMLCSFGDILAATAAGGRNDERSGNRVDWAAPHGCYPCRGDDRWCAIAVLDDGQWEALCGVASRPDWLEDPRWASTGSRLDHVDALEEEIAAWTALQDPYDLEARLQAAGVPAGVVQTAEDHLRPDSQLMARKFFENIEHELKGRVVAAGIPLGLTGTPGRTPGAGRGLGADNDAIFGDLLGLSGAELAGLRAAGVVQDPEEEPIELPR
jgi:crotonobetainyl-CoA:carnitine CoA-transferase CaiB-like acyl-CoA transferase